MDKLQTIVDTICEEFEAKNAVRDETLRRSRQLIRHCANSIRASHRDDFADAQALLATAQSAAAEMIADTQQYPDIFYAGYTQDALKELSEAHITYALITGESVPTPGDLNVEPASYLNGLAEAVGELRRYVLDRLRRGDVASGERLLAVMDDIYSLLITVDFPDAITGGLRRNTDMVRGVLERTRGDLTTAVRQEEMKAALRGFGEQVGLIMED
ncbi:MAG: haloacid dehalogenase [Anaerolineae bacterium]